MSYDLRLEQVCPHRIVGEGLFLNSDRRTIRPLRHIASALSVTVRFNGEVEVPSQGAMIAATAKGSVPGPFNISSASNRLVVSVNEGPDQTIVAPVGRGINAKSLCLSLTAASGGQLNFQPTRRLQVQASTAGRGPAARLVFKPGSTLAPILGFLVGKAYRGQELFPPWSLINDPNTLSDRPTRFIVFDRAIESTTDFVEIGYTTIRQECRRCGGVGVEHDWQYTSSGESIKVRNADLLQQEILKLTYTEKGSNPFHPWYGTGLLEAIGKKLTDQGVSQNLILSDLHDAFRRWQSIKKSQEEEIGQLVSDEEFPFRLLVVNLQQDPSDPTVIFVNAFVQNRSTQPIQISRGLRLPQPLDILGSTAQDAFLAGNRALALGQ